MLIWHYLNVLSMWPQRQLAISYIESNLASKKYAFAERLIIFYTLQLFKIQISRINHVVKRVNGFQLKALSQMID